MVFSPEWLPEVEEGLSRGKGEEEERNYLFNIRVIFSSLSGIEISKAGYFVKI